MILLTLDFTNLTNFKLLLIQIFTLLIVMTQKKSTPKKAPKRAQRVERVERVEHSAPKDNKKRTRSPSDDDDEEESDGRSKKERRSNRNKLADTSQKTAPQKRKAAAQR